MLKKLVPVIMIMVLLTGCGGKDKIVYETYNYDKNEVKFKLEYPEGWTVKEIEVWDATPSEAGTEEVREASPERGGIDMYPADDSEINVGIYNVVSPYYLANIQGESIKTSELLNGKIKIADITQYTTEGQIHLRALYKKESPSDYYVAVVRVPEEYFKKHEEVLWKILKSVEY